MDETGFSGEVRLRLGSSRLLAGMLIAGHLVGALCLPLLKWGVAWCWPAILAIGVSLVHGLRREAWRCAGMAVTWAHVDGRGRLLLTLRNGRKVDGRLLPGSFAAPVLVILRWRPENGGRVRHTVVAADGTVPASHRLLRVLLRHPL
jgi:hypothetical protein